MESFNDYTNQLLLAVRVQDLAKVKVILGMAILSKDVEVEIHPSTIHLVVQTRNIEI